jgi:hypothetical protein
VADGDLIRIFAALTSEKVRYLVVGGVAVVLHGHPRLTADVDIVVSLDAENARAAIRALGALGYRPRAPVKAEDFADATIRRSWVVEKGLRVFSLWSPAMPATEVDVFVEEPFPFDEAYARAVHVQIGTTSVTVASLSDVVALKRAAGRPHDLSDADALEAIARLNDNDGDE